MNTLCYSVRLESLTRISDKCFRARAFDGSEALIPAQFVFGQDFQVGKSDAFWIAKWILERKSLQYSSKKQAWFNKDGIMMPSTETSHYTPAAIAPVESNEVESLKK